MRLLLLGATGLVGSEALSFAFSTPAISEIIAVTRTPLEPRKKMINLVDSDLEELARSPSVWNVDAVICALGTTKAKAGSLQAFRHVDYELPLVFASACHTAGVETFALVSAIGASTSSRFFYARTKGELEREMKQVGFRSLTICRPSIIDGPRDDVRVSENIALVLSRLLAPVLPKKFHINPASVIARSLIDSVVAAVPGCRWIFAEEMNRPTRLGQRIT